VEGDDLGAVAVEVLLRDAALVCDPGVVQAPGVDGAPGGVQGEEPGFGSGQGVVAGAVVAKDEGRVVEPNPAGTPSASKQVRINFSTGPQLPEVCFAFFVANRYLPKRTSFRSTALAHKSPPLFRTTLKKSIR
jgi:hypothetical protein